MTASLIYLPDFCEKNKLALLLKSGFYSQDLPVYSHRLSTEEAEWFTECLQEAVLSLILAQ